MVEGSKAKKETSNEKTKDRTLRSGFHLPRGSKARTGKNWAKTANGNIDHEDDGFREVLVGRMPSRWWMV